MLHRSFSPPVAEAYYRPFARAAKTAVDIPVILVGGLRSTQMMDDIVWSGDADFLAMARPFVREPDLVNKIAHGSAPPGRMRILQYLLCTRRNRSAAVLANSRWEY